MKLRKITIQNFMPFYGTQVVTFPTEPARNVMLVFGDNMRGKTSFLNAIRWCFYGVAMGRHLRHIPLHKLPNIEAARVGDWVMEVSIQFEADGHQYDLRRRATKKNLRIKLERPEDLEEEVGLQRDGLALPGHKIESEINRFVPEQVSRFFLFDGELLQEYEELLIEGSDQGKRIKEAIEQVLGVPALIHGREETTTLLNRAQKQQNKDLAHVKGLERQVERQGAEQAKQDALASDMKSLKSRLEGTKGERAGLDDELEVSESIHEAKLALDIRRERQNQVLKDLERLHTEKLELISKAWKDLLQPKLSLKLEQMETAQNILTEQISVRSALDTEIAQLKRTIEKSVCSACGQEVSREKREKASMRIGELEGKARNNEVNQQLINANAEEISKLNRLVGQSSTLRIHDKDNDIARLDIELTKVENDIENLSDEIQGHDTAEIARKRSLRDKLVKEEGRLERDIEDTKKQIDRVAQELAIIRKQLEANPQSRAARSSKLVEIYAGLERAFAASIETLRDKLRRNVEEQATNAFREMTTQSAYQGLKINESYGLAIVDDTGEQVSVRSAGAEQIVALSLIDGLSRTGRAEGPVVMDTPFGRLDTKHRDNILRYLPSATNQLIFLVHDGEIRREIDLQPIANRLGAEYMLREINPRHTVIEKVL